MNANKLRRFAHLLALAPLALALPAHADPPFFVVYGLPQGSGPLDPGTFPTDGNGMPLIPPAPVAIGAPVDVELFFHRWPSNPSAPVDVCGDQATGSDVCAWHLLLVPGPGMTIQLFTAASSDVAHVLANNTVEVMGGNPSTGQADAVWIGTLELAASQANATLEARPGGDNALGFLDANLAAQTIPFAIVAGSVNTCGVPPALPLDANEECDDGNTVSGDGCYRNCQIEDLFRLEGTATQNGNIEIVLETETIVTPTVTGETAPQVVANVVLLINANTTLTVSAEAVGPGDTAVSDGTFVSVISNTQGIDLPEPGGIMLLPGIAFLLIVGRKRIKS